MKKGFAELPLTPLIPIEDVNAVCAVTRGRISFPTHMALPTARGGISLFSVLKAFEVPRGTIVPETRTPAEHPRPYATILSGVTVFYQEGQITRIRRQTTCNLLYLWLKTGLPR